MKTYRPTCPDCKIDGEEQVYTTFSFWLCPKCKKEIGKSSAGSTVLDELARLLNEDNKDIYLYLSADVDNLNKAFYHCLAATSLTLSQGRARFVKIPDGFTMLRGTTFSGVFIDSGSIAAHDLMNNVKPLLTYGAFEKYVDPKTLVVL